MFAAIREGPSPYTEAQRRAWLSAPCAGPEWSACLAGQQVMLAERAGRVLGFMTMREHGYINLAFVLPQAQRQGVFTLLLGAFEGLAQQRRLTSLETHASLTARPAFMARGFHAISEETVARGGQYLTRTRMEKTLT
ncbi:GNAT family N-acetyltransferase [Sulfitobacter aestuarii]|uniref:GNAT family N-acetyltransferase n=1 Tax=Sulfitobacter aestuarii TaxID=2161676 RepID=A0ABW5TXU6_9RHOB